MKRMWINQPSKLQSLHEYHGLNVIAPIDRSEIFVTVYPTYGPIISMMVPSIVLSEGWLIHET